jgi:hypothetical protein
MKETIVINGIRVTMPREKARVFLAEHDAAVTGLRAVGTAADPQAAGRIDRRRQREAASWGVYRAVRSDS